MSSYNNKTYMDEVLDMSIAFIQVEYLSSRDLLERMEYPF